MLRRLPANAKITSVLRRVPNWGGGRYAPVPGLEGHVCAFRVAPGPSPLIVEAVCGRAMTLLPGDIFLGTAGNRISFRMVGSVPKRGLVPGGTYWLLAESGLVGDLVGSTPGMSSFLGRVTYLGAVHRDDGEILTIRQFTAAPTVRQADHGAQAFVIVGTAPEVGKTTAGTAVVRMLLAQKRERVIALKATGTSCVTETMTYRDYGAAETFDFVDFGLPTTHPAGRKDISGVFDAMLEVCLSIPADAVIMECGGDLLGANVPVFLQRLKRRRRHPTLVLAAADALGAFGAIQILRDFGLSVDLITGPCTDTRTSQERTEKLCKTHAMNLSFAQITPQSVRGLTRRVARRR